MEITCLDSYKMLNTSLDEVLTELNTSIRKGKFPYRFVNESNLYYRGPKPSFSYYENISFEEYKTIPSANQDLPLEVFKYLKTDILGLLEVMLKFSQETFNKYSINIINYRTLPGLSVAVYT